MVKRLGIILSLLMFVSIGSSLISLSEPDDIYNLGDKLFVTVTNLRGFDKGNFNVDLVCGEKVINLLRLPATTWQYDVRDSYSFNKLLSKEDLELEDVNSIIGECKLRSNLADEIAETKSFTISNEIVVSSSIEKLRYNPGEELVIFVEAKKANGEPFEGLVKFSGLIEEETQISEGELIREIKISEDARAGEYFVNVIAFNSDSDGEMTNSGSSESLVFVNQVPSSIELIMSGLEVVPGDTLKINAKVLDQVGELFEGSISLHLTDPEENKYDFSILSGEQLEIPFETNATKGKWSIYATAHKMVENIEFDVLSLNKADYFIEGNVLTIKNVGNIEYFGITKVNIGENVQEIELRLGVGEEKEFILEAPDGEYEILIDDSYSSFSGKSFLTGNAVRVREAGEGGGWRSLSVFWILMIFLVGSMGIIMIGMYKKTSFKDKLKAFGGRFRKTKKKQEKPEENMIDFNNRVSNAESSLVLNGEKVSSVIVSINIKEKNSYSQEVLGDILKIIKDNCGSKGVIDIKEEYIYLIYSPLITRSYKNEFLATNSAVKISKAINEYKKGMSGELVFGIGVNKGELVSKKEGSKLKYTGIGNTISFANKIAGEANNDVLISDEIRKFLLRELKTKKVTEIGNSSIYLVEEIKNKEANNKKLQDLLNRMKEKKDS